MSDCKDELKYITGDIGKFIVHYVHLVSCKILTSVNLEFRSNDANVSSFSGVGGFSSGGDVYFSNACANPPRFFSVLGGILSQSSISPSVEKYLFKWHALEQTNNSYVL